MAFGLNVVEIWPDGRNIKNLILIDIRNWWILGKEIWPLAEIWWKPASRLWPSGRLDTDAFSGKGKYF